MATKQPKLNELHDAYRAVFSTPDGERVLQHLCKSAFIHDSTYVQGDSHETVHREGQRRLGLSILRFIDKDPKDIQAMMENNNG